MLGLQEGEPFEDFSGALRPALGVRREQEEKHLEQLAEEVGRP